MLNPDRVRPEAKFWVGQKVTFEPVFVPASAETPKKPVRWCLEGEFVNSFNQPCADCSINYVQDTSLLANETTSAWWITSAWPAQYHSLVGMHLKFANGQEATVTGKGLFAMYRPKLLKKFVPTPRPPYREPPRPLSLCDRLFGRCQFRQNAYSR